MDILSLRPRDGLGSVLRLTFQCFFFSRQVHDRLRLWWPDCPTCGRQPQNWQRIQRPEGATPPNERLIGKSRQERNDQGKPQDGRPPTARTPKRVSRGPTCHVHTAFHVVSCSVRGPQFQLPPLRAVGGMLGLTWQALSTSYSVGSSFLSHRGLTQSHMEHWTPGLSGVRTRGVRACDELALVTLVVRELQTWSTDESGSPVVWQTF